MSDNPVPALIEIIKTSVTRMTELIVEMKSLLNNYISNSTNQTSGHKSAIDDLKQHGEVIRQMNIKLDVLQKYLETTLLSLFESSLNKVSRHLIDDDKCISERCPQKPLFEELKEDKMRIIEAHEKSKQNQAELYEKDTDWWKKVSIFLGIACLVFMIGMILTATFGSKGVEMFFDLVKNVPLPGK